MSTNISDAVSSLPTTASVQSTIRVRGGRIGIAVQDSGGNGHTCVFLHGLGDNFAVWTILGNSILENFRSVRVDLCGHGDSDWDPEGCYEAETLARDIIEVLSTAGIGSPVLIGHSLGADIALRLTRLLEQPIAGLVLIDYSPESNPVSANNVRDQISSTPRNFACVDDYVHWLEESRPLARIQPLRDLAAHALRLNDAGVYELKLDRRLGEMTPSDIGSDDRWSLIKSVSCPALVVRGIGSAVLSSDVANQMVDALPNGTLAVVAGAGHAIMTDNPDGLVLAVKTFLKTRL